MDCYVLLYFTHLLTSVSVDNLPMIKTGHSTHVSYMHYLQLLHTPFPPNPTILCAGN